jgi:hypothetical protein
MQLQAIEIKGLRENIWRRKKDGSMNELSGSDEPGHGEPGEDAGAPTD